MVSDTWVGVEVVHTASLRDISMPEQVTPYTDLLNLAPLPVTALQEESYMQLYSKIETFNPVQTQLFHVLYHTDSPVFLGAPTGSGKTFVAELALLRMKVSVRACVSKPLDPLCEAYTKNFVNEFLIAFHREFTQMGSAYTSHR